MKYLRTSALQLKDIRCLTLTALMIALSIIFSYLSIQVSDSIRISFKFLPVAVIGFLFGPVVGAITGGIVDIVGFLIKPIGALNLGITLCSIVTGLIYGLILYHKKISLQRTAVTFVLAGTIADIFMKSYFLAVMTGITYQAEILMRLPVVFTMMVVNTVAFYTLSKYIQKK